LEGGGFVAAAYLRGGINMESQFVGLDLNKIAEGYLAKRVGNGFIGLNPVSITGDGEAPLRLTSKTVALTGDTVLDVNELAQHINLTGTLSGDTFIELPTPDGGEYALYIRNDTTGGDLFVQKTGGLNATQILNGQTALVRVTA
jgi:hypothetical protein